MDLWALVVLPLGLGLLGFVEPCTVGSSLLFVKYLEGKDRGAKLLETATFTVTRALFLGGLGALAGFAGSTFFAWQRGFWVLLGGVYAVIGACYLTNRQGLFMHALGPRLEGARNPRGAAALGLLFGLNIPACAAPLLAAVMAASLGVGSVARGGLLMAEFGLALSLPLLAAVLWSDARRWLDRLVAVSRRAPRWTGVVFLVLGAWSIYYGVGK